MTELDWLYRKFDDEIAALTDIVMDGGCGSMDEYGTITGRVAGVRYCRNLVKELERRLVNEDDDEV